MAETLAVFEGLKGLKDSGILDLLKWLILLAVVCVGGFFVWANLVHYGLCTAFILFVGGLIFIFALQWMKFDINEHVWIVIVPIILGLLGFLVEYMKIWKISFTTTLNTSSFQFLGLDTETTIGIQMILAIITALFCGLDFIVVLKRKKK